MFVWLRVTSWVQWESQLALNTRVKVTRFAALLVSKNSKRTLEIYQVKFFKLLLKPLIWIKDFQDNAVSYLTKKVDKKVGASKPNKFKTWKLKQPVWKQFLIELPIYILILWLLNLLFNQLGYKITPW